MALYLPGLVALPPLDRDEARFAQATRQMLETGDFVDIHFQEEPRHKKPIGIYWLQAASVSLAAGDDRSAIWAYRLPSVAGAVLAVLLAYAWAASSFGNAVGFLTAAFLGSSLLVVLEAHQAKTDAALLATVLAAQWALARLYLGQEGTGGEPTRFVGPPLVFWVAQAAGILLKGPITPLISLLTLATLAIVDWRARWLAGLKPLIGLPLMAALVAPWAIAVLIATDGAFFSTALQSDFLPKLVSGHESHGAPPGTYLLLVLVFLWPASLFLWPALVKGVHDRRLPEVRFCLAWLVPAWLLFEFIPTKLPHYVLPLYPALAALAAKAVVDPDLRGFPPASVAARIGAGLWAVIPVTLAVSAVVLPWRFGDGPTLWSLPTARLALAVLGAGVLFWRGQKRWAAAAAVVLGGLTLATALEWVVPRLTDLRISDRLATAIAATAPDRSGPVALAGYSEPSAVFLLGTGTILTDGAGAGRHLLADPGHLAAVSDAHRQALEEAVTGGGARAVAIATVAGFNYSKGTRLTLTVFRGEPVARPEVPAGPASEPLEPLPGGTERQQ